MLGFSMRAISVVLTFAYTLIMLAVFSVQPQAPEQAVLPADNIPLGQSSGVVVDILQCREEISLPLQQAVERYRQETGDVRISVQTVAGVPEYQAALRAKLLSGQQVDVFQVFGQKDIQSLEGYLTDLSHMDWLHTAMDGTLDAVTTDTGVYGIPYALEGVGLIANRDMFQAAGISLDAIVTFKDLTDAFAKMREIILSGDLVEQFPNLEVVTEFPAQSSAYLSRQMVDIALTGAFATPMQGASSPVIEFVHSEGVEDYFRLLASYTDNRVHWNELTGISQYRQIEDGLAAGRVAIIQQNADIYKQVRSVDPELVDRLVMLPIPLEGVENSGIYTGVPAYWAVNAQADEETKAAAQAFLTWLYQSETGAAIVAQDFGAVSVFRDKAVSTGIPLHSQMLEYVRRGRTWPWIHAESPQNWGSEVFAPGIRSWLKGDLEWEDHLSKCMQEWN